MIEPPRTDLNEDGEIMKITITNSGSGYDPKIMENLYRKLAESLEVLRNGEENEGI